MYCGKCGSKLDETTGLCPKCDRKQTPKRLTFFAAVTFVVIAAALLWYIVKKPARSTLETIPAENETVIDATQTAAAKDTEPTKTETVPETTEYYWGSTLVTKDNSGTICFSMNYLGCTGDTDYGTTGVAFYVVAYGPSIILGIGSADFDGNGAEDELVVSLEAAEALPFDRENYGAPDEMNYVQLRLDIDFKNEDGVAVRHETQYEPITAETQKKISVSIKGNKIIYTMADDLSSALTDGKHAFFPVTDLVKNHREAVTVYCFDQDRAFIKDYVFAAASVYNEKINDIQLIQYLALENGWNGPEDAVNLYSRKITSAKQNKETLKITFTTDESGKATSEAEACELVATTLQELYGVNGFDLKPCVWDRRWEHTVIPDREADGLVCVITMNSTVSTLNESNQTTGVTSVKAEYVQ